MRALALIPVAALVLGASIMLAPSPIPPPQAPAVYDLDGDGAISILDLALIADYYGQAALPTTCYSLVRNIPPDYTPAPGVTPPPHDSYFSFLGPALQSDDAAFIGVPTTYPEYPALIGHGRAVIKFCPDSFDDYTPP